MLPILYMFSLFLILFINSIPLPVEFVKIHGLNAPEIWSNMQFLISLIIIFGNIIITLWGIRWVYKGDI